MGCPIGADIISCYHEAQPGDHQGRLGFDLVAVFETFPKLDLPLLGEIEINDQYAEEAFTFYDHPKVLIFKKSADFNAEQVRATLSTVDLAKVVRLTPRQFDEYASLLLPADRLASQRAGGTWSELFDYDWLQNKYPVLGLLIWYIFIFILGLAVYPIIRLAMPGLADKGYPLSRALGLVIFAYLSWLAGSVGIPYTRTTIAVVFGAILVTGAVLGRLQRDELIAEFKTKRKYFLIHRRSIPRLLRHRPAHPPRQPGPVASRQRRRAPHGLLLLQRRHQKHLLPALRPVVRGRLHQLLLLRLRHRRHAGQTARHRPVHCLQLHPAHPVRDCRNFRLLDWLEPAVRPQTEDRRRSTVHGPRSNYRRSCRLRPRHPARQPRHPPAHLPEDAATRRGRDVQLGLLLLPAADVGDSGTSC